MAAQIKDLRWKCMWTTHMGCLKGCLDYLKIDMSDAWLFGATGHAFLLNVHEDVCPSGPTAWNTSRMSELGKNLGYKVDGVFAQKQGGDFDKKKELAWKHTKEAINQGRPCYGWELNIPEYYVVYGYDDVGYYYSGPMCDEGKGVKPWKDLGETEIGIVEMYAVEPSGGADDKKAVREALRYALEHSKSPKKWIFPKYRSGPAGYDLWIKALEEGRAHSWGMAYNSAVWNECRHYAADFLREAKARSDPSLGQLFDQAARHYEMVARCLKEVTRLFPFPPKGDEVKNPELCRTGAEFLGKAKGAEVSGLSALESILKRL